MTTINCGICGEKINITKKNAYDKIKEHKKYCSPRKMTMIAGFYLSKQEREADIYE